MRKFILIAAIAFVSATSAQAGEQRSLTLAGVDEKVPAALGKAAETPKLVEAPRIPDTPKAVEAPPAVEAPKAAETPKADEAPKFVGRPSAVGTKTDQPKAGQVTFEDDKPAAVKDKRTARTEKPRRKRYWNEARIMRELSRYGIYW